MSSTNGIMGSFAFLASVAAAGYLANTFIKTLDVFIGMALHECPPENQDNDEESTRLSHTAQPDKAVQATPVGKDKAGQLVDDELRGPHEATSSSTSAQTDQWVDIEEQLDEETANGQQAVKKAEVSADAFKHPVWRP